MKRIWLALTGAVTAFSLTACGTVYNLTRSQPEVPFGGVQADWEVVQSDQVHMNLGSGPNPWILLVLPGEMALSFVGDTLTMPLAIWKVQKAGEPGDRLTTPIKAGEPKYSDSSMAYTHPPEPPLAIVPNLPKMQESAQQEPLRELGNTRDYFADQFPTPIPRENDDAITPGKFLRPPGAELLAPGKLEKSPKP